jgi:hypothetical protein
MESGKFVKGAWVESDTYNFVLIKYNNDELQKEIDRVKGDIITIYKENRFLNNRIAKVKTSVYQAHVRLNGIEYGRDD